MWTWCEALSSGQRTLRELPWSLGNFTKNHVIFTYSSANFPMIQSLEQKIFYWQNFNRYVRKFLPPSRPRAFIFSLIPGCTPVSDFGNHEKSMFIELIMNASGNVWESLEISYNVSKCSVIVFEAFQTSCFLWIYTLVHEHNKHTHRCSHTIWYENKFTHYQAYLVCICLCFV